MRFPFAISCFLLACLSPLQAFEVGAAEKSVVRLLVGKKGNSWGTGSGFIINSRGHIVTNHHVAGDAEHIFVWYRKKSTVEIHRATLVASNPDLDLAVIRAPNLNAEPVEIASGEPKKGETVIALGYPSLNDTDNRTKLVHSFKGAVSSIRSSGRASLPDSNDAVSQFVDASVQRGNVERVGEASGVKVIFHSAAIKSGNSGGPLFNQHRQVVGVNTLVLAPDKFGNVKISTSSDVLHHFLEQQGIAHHSVAIKHGKPTPLYLYALFALLIVAILTALYLALFKRQVIVQQAARVTEWRKDRSHRPQGPKTGRGPAQPKEHPPAQPPASDKNQLTWRFEGVDRSTGQTLQLNLTPDLIKQADGKYYVGRSKIFADYVVHSQNVSRQQLGFFIQNGELYMEDRNATNPTKHNDRKLTPFQPSIIKSGHRISFGDVEWKVNTPF